MRKRLLSLSLCAVLCLLLCACVSAQTSGSPSPALVKETTAPIADPTKVALEIISSGLDDKLSYDDYNISYARDKLILKISDQSISDSVVPCIESKSAPKDWDDIVSGVVETNEILKQLSEETGLQIASYTIYLQSDLEDGDIFLTVSDGKAVFSTFNKVTSANDPTISLEEFNKIQTGITYQEVINIIGSPGQVLSEVDIGAEEYRTVVYMWKGEGIIGANANITIQGGTVAAKAQIGLE